tara:strand:+ start:1140 stop:1808 length:669 start_codon:yes stop_codon:yes gene_type:complete
MIAIPIQKARTNNAMNYAWSVLKAQTHLTTIRPDPAMPDQEPQSIDPQVASMAARYRGEKQDPKDGPMLTGKDAYDSNQDSLEIHTRRPNTYDPDFDHEYAAKRNAQSLKNKQMGRDPINTDPDDLSDVDTATRYEPDSSRAGGNQAIKDIRSRIQRMPRPGERGGGGIGEVDTSQTTPQVPEDPYDPRNYNFSQPQPQQHQLQAPQQPQQQQQKLLPAPRM